MSAIAKYLFDNPANWIYDINKIEFLLGLSKLKLTDNPDQDFQIDCDDDTGMDYDDELVRFTEAPDPLLAEQIDQTPEDSTFGATYTEDINGNFGGGILDGTAFNGAAVSSGKLDLTGGSAYVSYDPVGNMDSLQTGCLRYKYTPDYSGYPSETRYLFTVGRISGNNNLITLTHTNFGRLYLTAYDGAGVIMINNLFFDVWSATSGQEYEMEFNYDFTTGATTFFIDGIQIGTAKTNTGVRSGAIDLFHIGASKNGAAGTDAFFDNVLFFSEVQHTENYTPGYTLPEKKYLESAIVTPELEYTNAGTLVSFDSFFATITGATKLSLQIARSGDYLYLNGTKTEWIVSDGSYSQSTSPADFHQYGYLLPVNGEIYGQFKVHFPDSNIQSSITTFTASLTAQIYPIDNPTMELAQSLRIEQLLDFIETIEKSGLDNIKFDLKKDTDYYYFNEVSGEWGVSDNSYTQTNTGAEIKANAESLTAVSVNFNVRIYFHSENGQTTPSISELELIYDFSGEQKDERRLCSVYWYAVNPDDSNCTHTVRAIPSAEVVRYKNNVQICPEEVSEKPDSETGYVELDLIENENMIDKNGDPVTYILYNNDVEMGHISVPDADGALMWDILI